MKKRMLALILALALCAAVTGASAENPLEEITDSLCELLFRTDNVTLEGQAAFSLDQQVTPRKDGTEGKSGYTVVGNGEFVYVIEAMHPDVYRTGTCFETSSIIHESIQTRLLEDFIRLLAADGEAFLGQGTVTSSRDGDALEVQLKVGMHAPEMVDVALNMAAQFAAKRWFGMDTDFLSPESEISMSSFITPVQGILWTARYLALVEADVALKTAADATFESAEGHLFVLMETAADGVRPLDVTFSLRASDYGASEVALFDPEAYGVELAEDQMIYNE